MLPTAAEVRAFALVYRAVPRFVDTGERLAGAARFVAAKTFHVRKRRCPDCNFIGCDPPIQYLVLGHRAFFPLRAPTQLARVSQR